MKIFWIFLFWSKNSAGVSLRVRSKNETNWQCFYVRCGQCKNQANLFRHGWIELVELNKNIRVLVFFSNIFDEKMEVFFNSPFFEKIPKNSIYFKVFWIFENFFILLRLWKSYIQIRRVKLRQLHLFLILLHKNMLIKCREPVSKKNVKNGYAVDLFAKLSSFLDLKIYLSFIHQ